jgi:hypothetical protein
MSYQGSCRNFVIGAAALVVGLAVAARANEAQQELPDLPPPLTIQPLMLADHTVGNPALEQHGPTSAPAESSIPDLGLGGMVHPWLLPPVTVVGKKPSDVREEQLVGTYGQPVWTVDRRFVETRVYVRPEGSLEFEFWFIPQVPRKGHTEIDTQYELEFGLPHRFQLDLYLTNRVLTSGGPTFTDGAIEIRYAFADWDVIWGNPTYYIEYTHQDQGPDQLETKMLFGGIAAPRVHWGLDLTYQRNMGGDNENTFETTAGLSYTVVDNLLDAGAEFKLQENNFHGSRHKLHDNTLIGPSFQYRPIPRMHIDFTPLIGITHESEALEAYLIVGWEF